MSCASFREGGYPDWDQAIYCKDCDAFWGALSELAQPVSEIVCPNPGCPSHDTAHNEELALEARARDTEDHERESNRALLADSDW